MTVTVARVTAPDSAACLFRRLLANYASNPVSITIFDSWDRFRGQMLTSITEGCATSSLGEFLPKRFISLPPVLAFCDILTS